MFRLLGIVTSSWIKHIKIFLHGLLVRLLSHPDAVNTTIPLFFSMIAHKSKRKWNEDNNGDYDDAGGCNGCGGAQCYCSHILKNKVMKGRVIVIIFILQRRCLVNNHIPPGCEVEPNALSQIITHYLSVKTIWGEITVLSSVFLGFVGCACGSEFSHCAV